MGRVFLVRHGQTDWNREEVFRGTHDIPLNGFGRIQAQAIGHELSRRGLRDPLFFSSPLGRAVETAEIAVAVFSDRPVEKAVAFTDINFGDWQGKPHREIEKLFPGLYKEWLTKPETVLFPGGETLEQVAGRSSGALLQMARTFSAHDLVIVSHRVVNKVLLGWLLGAGLNSFWKIKQDTACINILEYNGRFFVLNALNETCHLRPLAQADLSDF